MKNPTKEQAKQAAITYVSILLKDWNSNVKEFDIVYNDILSRLDNNLHLYIQQEMNKKPSAI